MKRTNHVFIRLTALLLTVFFCATLSSCLPLKLYSIDRSCEVEHDGDDLIYRGVRYVNTENYGGTLGVDFSSDECVLLGAKVYSYLFVGFSAYYADSADSPTIIACERTRDVWLKEGLDIKDIILNNENRINDLTFKLSEVIEGEVSEYWIDHGYVYKTLLYTYCPLNLCSAFYFAISIHSRDDELYIMHDYKLYAVSDEFEEALYESGLLDDTQKAPSDGAQTIAYK